MSRPPNILVPGRGRGRNVPRGYILGRVSGGRGPVELLNAAHLPALGVATPALINQAIAAIPPDAGITPINKSASFTTTAAYNTYFLDTAGGAYTVTLNATPATGEVVEVWDSTGHAGTNAISFAGNGNNIAGVSSVANFIAVDYGHARLIFTGAQWLAQ